MLLLHVSLVCQVIVSVLVRKKVLNILMCSWSCAHDVSFLSLLALSYYEVTWCVESFYVANSFGILMDKTFIITVVFLVLKKMLYFSGGKCIRIELSARGWYRFPADLSAGAEESSPTNQWLWWWATHPHKLHLPWTPVHTLPQQPHRGASWWTVCVCVCV